MAASGRRLSYGGAVRRLIDFYETLILHYQPTRWSIYENPKWKAHPLVKKYPQVVDPDGSNAWQRFVHVVLPAVRPILVVIVLLRGIWMFNKFDIVWLISLPLLAILVFLGRWFVGGLTVGALKG